MMIANTLIEQEYIQWGFAGFAFLLLCINVWMFKQLIDVITKNNSVIAKLIDAIKSVENSENSTKESVDRFRTESKENSERIEGKVNELRDKMISRPCIHRGEL